MNELSWRSRSSLKVPSRSPSSLNEFKLKKKLENSENSENFSKSQVARPHNGVKIFFRFFSTQNDSIRKKNFFWKFWKFWVTDPPPPPNPPTHNGWLKNHSNWSRYKNISIIPYIKVKDSTALRVYLKDEWTTLLKVTEPPYFGTKSPKSQNPEFSPKIGLCQYSSFIVQNHCAKFQINSMIGSIKTFEPN